MTPQENGFLFTAQTPNAEMQHAVGQTAEQIEKELQLCNTLATFKHFTAIPGSDKGPFYIWKWSGGLISKIEPDPSANYVYIHGAFRPNTQKLLELLSGIELYGNRMVAVREVLQNAFDAVREQIAHKRLKLSDPSNLNQIAAITELCEVTLTLDVKDGVVWLVCKDNGVGMTKSIIDKYLLVSGATHRHELLDLERRCKEKRFNLGRTGQFGIGVLSYFMLADRLELRTRRSQEAGSIETTGWRFVTEGVGSFGELTRDMEQAAGTELRLQLNAEVIGDDFGQWYEELKRFLSVTLRYLPCQFTLNTTLMNRQELKMSAGWQDITHSLKRMICADIKPRSERKGKTPIEYLSLLEREKYEVVAENWKLSKAEAEACLKIKDFQGELPDSLGHYRICLPYYDLPGGKSLVFLRVSEDSGNLNVQRAGIGFYYQWKGSTSTAWKGIHVRGTKQHGAQDSGRFFSDALAQLKGKLPVYLEVDWTATDAGSVTVDRNTFVLKPQMASCLAWLQEQVLQRVTEFVESIQGTHYANLSALSVDLNTVQHTPFEWLIVDNEVDGNYRWGCVDVPFVFSNLLGSTALRSDVCLQSGQIISQLPPISDVNADLWGRYLICEPKFFPPDKIVTTLPPARMEFLPVWEHQPDQIQGQLHVAGWTCSLPPKYQQVCGVFFHNYYCNYKNALSWNPDNHLVQSVNEESWEWSKIALLKSFDPLEQKHMLFGQRAMASAWIMRCLEERRSDMWKGLKDRESGFLENVWKLIFQDAARDSEGSWIPVLYWIADGSSTYLCVLSPDGWLDLRTPKGYDKYRPEVSEEWLFYIKTPTKNVDQGSKPN